MREAVQEARPGGHRGRRGAAKYIHAKVKRCDDSSVLYKYARSHLFIYLKWVNSVGCKW